jgi:hypothetical protein
MELAPQTIGPVSAKEAEKACKDYRCGGVEDWRLPLEDELRAYTIAQFSLCKDSGCDTHIILWSMGQETGFVAICSLEHHDNRVPWPQQPHNDDGNWKLGKTLKTDWATALPVRPVRLLKSIPLPKK